MKIGGLISEVTEKDLDLENVLLKIKIMARRSSRKPLEEWVDKEVSGYSNSDQLPQYRYLDLILVGAISNGYTRYPQIRLPVMHIEEEMRKKITHIKIHSGVRSIHEIIRKNHEMRSSIPPELFALLQSGIGNDYHLEEAHTSAGAAELIGVISTVKKIVLDFLLEIEGKVKDEDIDTPTMSDEMLTAIESAETNINSAYSLGF